MIAIRILAALAGALAFGLGISFWLYGVFASDKALRRKAALWTGGGVLLLVGAFVL